MKKSRKTVKLNATGTKGKAVSLIFSRFKPDTVWVHEHGTRRSSDLCLKHQDLANLIYTIKTRQPPLPMDFGDAPVTL